MNKRQLFFWIFSTFLFGIAFFYLIFSFPPSFHFQVASFSLPLFPVPLLLLGLFLLCLTTLFTKHVRQGFLLGGFTLLYLLIRLLGLTNLFFLILLLILLITIELFVTKKN